MSGFDWSRTLEEEYDDETNCALPGTYPIAVTGPVDRLASGELFAPITAAGCAYCNRWAVDFYTSGQRQIDGEWPGHTIERRRETTIIYACDQHLDTAAEELSERFGYAINALPHMELLQEVDRHRRMLHDEERVENVATEAALRVLQAELGVGGDEA